MEQNHCSNCGRRLKGEPHSDRQIRPTCRKYSQGHEERRMKGSSYETGPGKGRGRREWVQGLGRGRACRSGVERLLGGGVSAPGFSPRGAGSGEGRTDQVAGVGRR